MSKEYMEWLKDKGFCINCAKEKAWNGRTMCPECLDKNKERSERTRSTESKEQRRRYIKRKRELCIAFGICRECLKKPIKVGLKCTECYAKQNQRNERKRKVVKRNMRVELGLCYFCGNKAIEGRKTCEEHYKTQSKNFRKWHENVRDNSNHIWRKIQAGEVKKVLHYKEQFQKIKK